MAGDAAAPAPAPAPAAGGGGGKGGSKLGEAWGYAILVIVFVLSNAIGWFSGQLNTLLGVLQVNGGPILIGMAFFFLMRATKK